MLFNSDKKRKNKIIIDNYKLALGSRDPECIRLDTLVDEKITEFEDTIRKKQKLIVVNHVLNLLLDNVKLYKNYFGYVGTEQRKRQLLLISILNDSIQVLNNKLSLDNYVERMQILRKNHRDDLINLMDGFLYAIPAIAFIAFSVFALFTSPPLIAAISIGIMFGVAILATCLQHLSVKDAQREDKRPQENIFSAVELFQEHLKTLRFEEPIDNLIQSEDQVFNPLGMN